MSSQSKTAQQPVSGKNADKVFKGVAYACGILILVVLAAVALFLLFRAWPLIGGDQKANSDTISNFTGGKATSFWSYDLGENWPNEVGQGAKGTSGVISTVQQADGTIGYADASQAGNLGTVAVKVGDGYVPFSAEAAAKVVDSSPLDDSAKGDNRVVVKLDHNTTEKGAYPIVLVSYDIACPAYKDANTAKFVKSWLSYVTSDEGQQTAASAAGSAPMSDTMRQKIAKSIDAIETK